METTLLLKTTHVNIIVNFSPFSWLFPFVPE